MRKRNSFGTDDSGRSMMMYTTLVLILLSFFVLLVAKSNFDESKFANAAASLKQSLHALPGGRVAVGTESGLPDISTGFDQGGRLMLADTEVAQIRAVLAPALMDRQASIIHTKNQRIISLSAGLLFHLDETAVNEDAAETLTVFAEIMSGNNVPITVEGHTDNLPPQTEGVGDNWDIAGRRALAVMEFLTETGGMDPNRFSAFSYAGGKPLYSNSTPQGRARNNRVDLVLDFSRANARELENLAEKATTYNFRGFDFLLKNSPAVQP